MSFRMIKYIVLCGLMLMIFAIPASAIGVQPMVLDFQGRPGEKYSFEISLLPEDTQRIVHLDLYEPKQNLDGTLGFVEGDSDLYPPIGWIELERDRVIVPPGEPTVVNGTVTVPFSAGGSYSVIIMAEPAVEEAETGVNIIVRYAVRLTINVDRPGLRSELQILDMNLLPDEEEKPMLQIHVKNPSPFRFPISGEATLRDDSRRLVERVTLRTLSAWESGYESYSIYPGAELLLVAPISEPLTEGNYHLQNFLSYDTSKQLIKGKEIQVELGQFATIQDQLVRVKPETMDSSLQLGAATTHIIEVENRTTEALNIQIGAEDIETDYVRSAFDNLELEFRGDYQFVVEPKRSARTVLLVRSPRDVEPGGYYGQFRVAVFSADYDYLESHTIPLNILVGKEWLSSVEVQSLAVEATNDEYLFSVAFSNSGDDHLKPTGTVSLYDAEGEIVNTMHLELAEGQDYILPSMNGFLMAFVPQRNILPGLYDATVTIFVGNEKLGTADFEVVIEPEEDSHEEG